MEDLILDLSFLTKDDVNELDYRVGFTQSERTILDHLVAQDLYDEGMMQEMHLHRNKFYHIKATMLYKIIKYACDK